MEENEKTITLNMKIEIPIDEIGETLICDDSKSYPLSGYGYDIQKELYKILGGNQEIAKRLESEALIEMNNEARRKSNDDLEVDGYYLKYIEKVQRWAEEKIGESKLIDFL